MSKKSAADLNIIILTYNSQFWLKKTLESLKKHYLSKTHYQVEVTVVDNNSTDETLKILKKSFSWVSVIASPENNGFAAGNNLALKKSESRYTMLLNSDVESTEESNLDLLIEYMDRNPKVGVVTPALKMISGELDAASHRGEPTLWASFTYFAGLEKLFPQFKLFSGYHQWYKNLSEIHQIDACSGAAMIVRNSAMEKVGFLDEQFFMYAEDLDWCRRFREKNYQIVFYPFTTMIHHKNKSGIESTSVSTAKKTSRHFYDTMLQYYDKHYRDQYPGFVRHIIKYFLVHKKGAL